MLLEKIAETPPGQQKMVIQGKTVPLLQRELVSKKKRKKQIHQMGIFVLVVETKYLQFLLEQKIVNTKPYPANILMCL